MWLYTKVLLFLSLLISPHYTYAKSKSVQQSTVFSRIDNGVEETYVTSGDAYENLIKQIVYHCSKGQKNPTPNCRKAMECYKNTANGINADGQQISLCDEYVGTNCMMEIRNSLTLLTKASLKIDQTKLLQHADQLCPREKNNSADNCTILYNALKACTDPDVSNCNSSMLEYVSVINNTITNHCNN